MNINIAPLATRVSYHTHAPVAPAITPFAPVAGYSYSAATPVATAASDTTVAHDDADSSPTDYIANLVAAPFKIAASTLGTFSDLFSQFSAW